MNIKQSLLHARINQLHKRLKHKLGMHDQREHGNWSKGPGMYGGEVYVPTGRRAEFLANRSSMSMNTLATIAQEETLFNITKRLPPKAKTGVPSQFAPMPIDTSEFEPGGFIYEQLTKEVKEAINFIQLIIKNNSEINNLRNKLNINEDININEEYGIDTFELEDFIRENTENRIRELLATTYDSNGNAVFTKNMTDDEIDKYLNFAKKINPEYANAIKNAIIDFRNTYNDLIDKPSPSADINVLDKIASDFFDNFFNEDNVQFDMSKEEFQDFMLSYFGGSRNNPELIKQISSFAPEFVRNFITDDRMAKPIIQKLFNDDTVITAQQQYLNSILFFLQFAKIPKDKAQQIVKEYSEIYSKNFNANDLTMYETSIMYDLVKKFKFFLENNYKEVADTINNNQGSLQILNGISSLYAVEINKFLDKTRNNVNNLHKEYANEIDKNNELRSNIYNIKDILENQLSVYIPMLNVKISQMMQDDIDDIDVNTQFFTQSKQDFFNNLFNIGEKDFNEFMSVNGYNMDSLESMMNGNAKNVYQEYLNYLFDSNFAEITKRLDFIENNSDIFAKNDSNINFDLLHQKYDYYSKILQDSQNSDIYKKISNYQIEDIKINSHLSNIISSILETQQSEKLQQVLGMIYDAQSYNGKPEIMDWNDIINPTTPVQTDTQGMPLVFFRSNKGISNTDPEQKDRGLEYVEQMRTGDVHYPGIGVAGFGTYMKTSNIYGFNRAEGRVSGALNPRTSDPVELEQWQKTLDTHQQQLYRIADGLESTLQDSDIIYMFGNDFNDNLISFLDQVKKVKDITTKNSSEQGAFAYYYALQQAFEYIPSSWDTTFNVKDVIDYLDNHAEIVDSPNTFQFIDLLNQLSNLHMPKPNKMTEFYPTYDRAETLASDANATRALYGEYTTAYTVNSDARMPPGFINGTNGGNLYHTPIISLDQYINKEISRRYPMLNAETINIGVKMAILGYDAYYPHLNDHSTNVVVLNRAILNVANSTLTGGESPEDIRNFINKYVQES